jgi:putative transposase
MSKAGLVKHQRPKLLSDNGSFYIASELKEHFRSKGIQQVHGRQCHPLTQGKIERYHRSMKNVVKLDHYYCPEELVASLGLFVHYYNHERYHESLDNVTPADVYWGRKEQILKKRLQVKKQSLAKRRERYQMEKMKT